MALFERELEEQRLKAAIARAINSPRGSTVESVGADTARAGMTAGTTSAFANDLDARIDAEAMAKTFAGQESNIASQRAMAQSLRDRGMPEAKMVGQGNWATLQQPNWGETLEGVVNKLTGGYLEGQAKQNATQLDVDQTKQAGLAKAAEEEIRLDKLALEDKRFNIKQGNWKADYDQQGNQYNATNDLTRSNQQDDRDKGTPKPYQSLTDGAVIMAVETPTGEIFEYDNTGGRGTRLDASTWIPLQNPEATGSSSTVASQMVINDEKQDDRIELAEFNQKARERLAELNNRLKTESDIKAEEREQLRKERLDLRELERIAREKTGKSAIEAQEAITSGSAVLRRANMYEATGGNPAALFSDLTGYDLTEGGDIGATQRMIAILGSQGAAKDFARLNLKPISDYEANYIINDLNISSKDQPKSILTYTMQYNDMYKQALADGEKDGAIALGASEQVMNQRYDDQVILGSLRNDGNMTMGLTEMIENGLPVEEVYERLRKKLKNGTIDTREKQALLSLSQAY